MLDSPADFFGDENRARADEEHLLPGIALAEQHLALAQPALAQTGPQGSQLLLVQVTEQINLSQEGNVARLGHGVVSPLHGPALHHDSLDRPKAFWRRRLTLPANGALVLARAA